MHLVVGGISYWLLCEIPPCSYPVTYSWSAESDSASDSTLADLNIWGLQNLGLLNPLYMYLSALSAVWQC